MTALATRRWAWTHKWSSLVCTVFMLLLCLTGLPLIFYHEIDHALGKTIEVPEMAAGTPRASADEVVQAARRHHPGLVPLYLFAEEDEPNLWLVKLDTRTDTDERYAKFSAIDARTAEVLGEPNFSEGFMHVMYRLHVDLYAGLAGRLFLGLMGLLLVVAVVSGVVLYAPFMRKLEFGAVRRDRSPRLRWLDLHNLLGIVTVVWALAVGTTGIINTWADLILKAWQAEQTASLKQPAAAALPAAGPQQSAQANPVQQAMQRALATEPGMAVNMIAFPGTLLSTPDHYAVLLHGNTPLTARLTKPVLVEQSSGRVTEAQPRPWYVTALQVSQPLHFGDYGGMPMKILWALLDLATIIVLGSGLYLWLKRPARARTDNDAEFYEAMQGAPATAGSAIARSQGAQS
jgi:uncharacterized iron-regulated membrane protein